MFGKILTLKKGGYLKRLERIAERIPELGGGFFKYFCLEFSPRKLGKR